MYKMTDHPEKDVLKFRRIADIMHTILTTEDLINDFGFDQPIGYITDIHKEINNMKRFLLYYFGIHIGNIVGDDQFYHVYRISNGFDKKYLSRKDKLLLNSDDVIQFIIDFYDMMIDNMVIGEKDPFSKYFSDSERINEDIYCLLKSYNGSRTYTVIIRNHFYPTKLSLYLLAEFANSILNYIEIIQ